MTFSYKSDDYILLLNDLQRKVHEYLSELWYKIEDEEVKGMFPGVKRNSLYASYYKCLKLYESLEKAIESYCPPLYKLL